MKTAPKTAPATAPPSDGSSLDPIIVWLFVCKTQCQQSFQAYTVVAKAIVYNGNRKVSTYFEQGAYDGENNDCEDGHDDADLF